MFFFLRNVFFTLGAYEKQMRTLTSDNDKLKQHFHQTDRTMAQLKRENEELQQKVNNANNNKHIVLVLFLIILRKLIKNFQYFFL